MDRRPLLSLLLLAGISAAGGAQGADAAEGRKLVEQKRCEGCHASKIAFGSAESIYLRKDRRVTSLEKLKAQVATCNNELNLQMFPDEEEHVVAWLNERYYKFSAPKHP